jgi:hypothetical protein
VVRLELAHHAVPAVDPDVQLVGVVRYDRAEVGADLGADPLQHVVELTDQGRIAHPGQADGAVADQRGAFQLHEVAGRGLEDRAGHPNRAVVDPLEGRLAEVDLAAGRGQAVRVRLLVERVRRDRLDGAVLGRLGRPDHEAVGVDLGQDAVRGARQRDQRAALDDLAHVQGQPPLDAAHDRQSGAEGGVEGPPRQHDFGALLERRHQRLVSHLADDMGAGVDVGRREVAAQLEVDDVAGRELALQVVAVDVGLDDRQAEAEAVLGRDLADDLAGPGEVRRGAGPAGRADHQRDRALDRRPEQQPEVALHHCPAGERDAGPEVVRPEIGGPGVDGDQVRAGVECSPERRLRVAVPEQAKRRVDGERHRRASPGCLHSRLTRPARSRTPVGRARGGREQDSAPRRSRRPAPVPAGAVGWRSCRRSAAPGPARARGSE